jgi:hypothetical protein
MRLSYFIAQPVTGRLLVIGLSFFMMGHAVAERPTDIPRRPGLPGSISPYPAADSIPRQVGDIHFDPAIDDPAFQVTDSGWVLQYYNSGSYYLHHKKEIVRYFMTHYQPGADTVGQTGYCTIRFIINRAGETGRFRFYQLDTAYQLFSFSQEITGQLQTLTHQWKQWQPVKYKDKTYDTYQVLTFTLKNGRIVCITP